jgi:hypothetical protein
MNLAHSGIAIRLTGDRLQKIWPGTIEVVRVVGAPMSGPGDSLHFPLALFR